MMLTNPSSATFQVAVLASLALGVVAQPRAAAAGAEAGSTSYDFNCPVDSAKSVMKRSFGTLGEVKVGRGLTVTKTTVRPESWHECKSTVFVQFTTSKMSRYEAQMALRTHLKEVAAHCRDTACDEAYEARKAKEAYDKAKAAVAKLEEQERKEAAQRSAQAQAQAARTA